MNKEKINLFMAKLESEKKRLEEELNKVAHRNPEVKGDWMPNLNEVNTMSGDESDQAEAYATLENNSALEDSLEEGLNRVDHAIKKIETGSYGICEVCKMPIDEKRLEAFPAATTCLKHSPVNLDS